MTDFVDLVWRSFLPGRRRRLGGHILFATYLLAIASIILTNSGFLPEKLLHWAVLPAFLWSAISSLRASEILEIATRLSGSFILRAFVVYLVVLLVATDASRGLLPAEGRSMYLYLRWGAGLLLFLLVTAHLADDYPGFFEKFFVAMVAMLAVNAVVNIVPFVEAFLTDSAYRLEATFGTPSYRNATHVAPLFALYAAAALGLAASDRLSRFQTWIVGLAVPILLIGVALTQARGALVALGIAIVALVMMSRRRLGLFAAAVLCLCGGLIWLSPEIREALFSRGTSFRLELWKSYLELGRLHPLSGYGLDRTLNIEVREASFEQPHNALVWAQVRGGIVASLAAAFMLFGSLFAAFAFWRRERNIAPFLLLLMLCVVATTEIGFLIYPFGWIWLVFWLPVGIGAGVEMSLRSRRSVGEAALQFARDDREEVCRRR